ncbi:hypothetical protein RJ639_023401 [Escallonia herrerae]|uniref:RlpA-like protein double-psi beta-barrel domain-containing protein n=1 Tax=Escallonia herrerae TaxID=1293975 RepID=A0AA89AF54_9ASTE|nr:hypothetical protein RJ639_023401 [Escallonia herrerae]
MGITTRLIFALAILVSLFYSTSSITGYVVPYTRYLRNSPLATKCYGRTDQGNMVALLNESFFYDDRCGLNARVDAGGRVRVKIVDVCPPTLCDENTNLALSMEAFSQIADPAAGKIFVDYAT